MNRRNLSLIVTLLLLLVFGPAGAQTIFTVAGTGTGGYSGDGGFATAATLRNPQGIAVDAVGFFYIADYGNSVVRKVGGYTFITTAAGTGTFSYGGDGGAATSANLNFPTDVAIDNYGNLYICDSWNSAIRKVPWSGVITTIAGYGGAGFSGDSSAATAAKLNYPTGIAVDRSGNIFIADARNNRIRKITSATGIISTVAGSGSVGFGGDGGPATLAKFSQPNNIAVDTFGNLYIADGYNYRIRKVNMSGIISTIAGTGSAGFAGDGGAATAARMGSPYGIAVGGGNIYFADYDNNRVRKIDTSGIITTVAGNGSSYFSGDGGPATAAGMHPKGIAIRNGALYISDYTNFRIREVCDFPVAGAITGASSLCAGTIVPFADTAAGGVWSSGDNSVLAVDSTGLVTGVAAGSTFVIYTVTNHCGVDYTTALVTVNPQPDAGTIIGAGSFCYFPPVTLGNTVSGGSWSCTNTSVATISAAGTVYGIPPGGSTTIRYIARNSCGSDTALLPVNVLWPCEGGVEELLAASSQLSISPNPGSGECTLLLTSPFSEKGIATITNLIGLKVMEFSLTANTPLGINLKQPIGMYFISVVTHHGTFAGKLNIGW